MVKELIFNKIFEALKDTEKAESIQAGQKTHKECSALEKSKAPQ